MRRRRKLRMTAKMPRTLTHREKTEKIRGTKRLRKTAVTRKKTPPKAMETHREKTLPAAGNRLRQERLRRPGLLMRVKTHSRKKKGRLQNRRKPLKQEPRLRR